MKKSNSKIKFGNNVLIEQKRYGVENENYK